MSHKYVVAREVDIGGNIRREYYHGLAQWFPFSKDAARFDNEQLADGLRLEDNQFLIRLAPKGTVKKTLQEVIELRARVNMLRDLVKTYETKWEGSTAQRVYEL